MESVLETYDSSRNVRQPGYEPIIDFAKGVRYVQVDLGSRYGVETMAKYFRNDDRSVFQHLGAAASMATEIDDILNWAGRDKVAAFIHKDKDTGVDLATVFVSENVL